MREAAGPTLATRPPPAASDADQSARKRLISAAVDVFDRKGYHAASVREICERAGLTKPALYYHFGSKEGVLTAILEASASEFEAAVNRTAGAPGTAAERLARLCTTLYELSQLHVPLVRVAHAVYFGPPEAIPSFDFGRFDRGLTAAIERIVEDGIASGELRQAPVRELSLTILGVTAALLRRPEPIGQEMIPRVLKLVFEGVKSPRHVAGADVSQEQSSR